MFFQKRDVYPSNVWFITVIAFKSVELLRNDYFKISSNAPSNLVCEQDGSCPLGTTRHVPQEKFPRKPYKKSFIDQRCSVKMAGYWPRSFFCEFIDLDSVSVHKHAKKELGHYPAILTSHLVNWTHTYSPHYVNPVKSSLLILWTWCNICIIINTYFNAYDS